MKLLALDSGLAHFGWALMNLDTLREEASFIEVGAWVTKPGTAERNCDDTTLRCMGLYRKLRYVTRQFQPDAIAVEGVVFPRGRIKLSVISGLARGRGLADCLAVEFQLRLFERTPQAIKKATCGKGGDKAAVRDFMLGHFPGLETLVAHIPPAQREHAFDAAALGWTMVPDLQRMASTWE